MAVMQNMTPYAGKHTMLLTNTDIGVDTVTYNISGDRAIVDLSNQYPLKSQRYWFALDGVHCPTKFKNNESALTLFPNISGVIKMPPFMHDGYEQRYLGCINLNSEGNEWKQTNSRDTDYAFKLGALSSNYPHVHYPFEFTSLADIKNFTITLLNQRREYIIFETTKRPQYQIFITAYPKV